MLRLLAPVALLGLIASPALATTTKTKTTVKHHTAKPAKMTKKTTETKTQ